MKKLVFLLLMLTATAVGLWVFAPQVVRQYLPVKAQQHVDTLITKVTGNSGSLAVQGKLIREAFLRKHSLGFAIQDITLDNTVPNGILADPVLLNVPPLDTSQFVNNASTAWQLGAATGLTSADVYTPDYYAFVDGVVESICPVTHGTVANDLAANQVVDPTALAEKTATLLFSSALSSINLKARSSGCVPSTTGSFIYYQLLYGQGLKSQKIQ